MKPESKIKRMSPMELVIVIATGVCLGNVISFGLLIVYQSSIIEDVAIKERPMVSKSKEQVELEGRQLRSKELEQKSIRQQLIKTCNFWERQVEKEDIKENRRLRDTACAKVN